MLRPRSPNPVPQKFESEAQSVGSTSGAGANAAAFKYPLTRRECRSPLVNPLAIVAPGAKLAPSRGVLPCPRNAVPALESKIENGVPFWKIETPLISHPPSAARFMPVACSKNGSS
jgi:hypothetical protein